MRIAISSTNESVFQCLKTVLWCFNEQNWFFFAPPPSINTPTPPFLNKKMFFLSFILINLSSYLLFFNLMRRNDKGIKWLFDLLLRMVYVQGFGLWNGQGHESVLINNHVRVGGGTIFFWKSDNPNKTFPLICLDLWKILCFRSNLFRRKMFDYNRPAPILLKPVPQRQALLVVQFYL